MIVLSFLTKTINEKCFVKNNCGKKGSWSYFCTAFVENMNMK